MASLSPAERSLITIKSVFAAASSIAAIFLNLYLFVLGGFGTVARFYLADFTVLTLGFIVAGKLLGRYKSATMMAVGQVALGLVYLVVLLLGKHSAEAVLLLGALQGFGEALYWPAFNLSEFRSTTEASRPHYFGRSNYFSQIAATVGPPLAGISLAAATWAGNRAIGYNVLFAFLLGNFAVGALLALRCESGPAVKFSPSQIGAGLKNALWRNALGQWFLRGMWVSAFPAFSVALLYSAIHQETTVAIVIAGGSIVSALMARVAARLMHTRNTAFLIGAFAMPFGIIGFALNSGWFGVVCFIVVISGFDPFTSLTTSRHAYTGMDAMALAPTETYHLLVENEIAINSGRVISFILVLSVLGAGNGVFQVRSAILVAALIPLAVGLLQHRFSRAVLATS